MLFASPKKNSSLFAMGWFAGLVWLIALAVGCQIAHINAPMRRAIESQDQSTITQALRRFRQTAAGVRLRG